MFAYLREHLGEDVTSANLVINGRSSVVVATGDELVDALRQGQGVFNVLALGGVKSEVDAAIVELRPGSVVDDLPGEPRVAGDPDGVGGSSASAV